MSVEVEVVHEDQKGPTEGARMSYDLLKVVDKPLYKGCTKHSKCSAIVGLYHLKCMSGRRNTSFTWLLEFVNDLLPPEASLPKHI